MLRPSILVFVATLSIVGVLAAMNACSAPDSVTPDCVFNVGGNGVVPKPNGCEGFAPCLDGNGNAQAAVKCCVDAMGNTLIGDALTSCLYLYGTGLPPGSTSSGGTGGSGPGDAGHGDAGDGG